MNEKKIGELLCEAHLIEDQQLKVALIEKNIYPELKIGEILSLHGWIKEETADFFGSEIQIINQEKNLLIGSIFLKAGLLSKNDINNILQEQKQIGYRFGETAVLKGLLKRETVDFFVNKFALYKDRQSFYKNKKETISNQSQNSKVPRNIRKDQITTQIVDVENIPWVD